MFVFLLALLLIAALQWIRPGVYVSTGSHTLRIRNVGLVTLLGRLSSAICTHQTLDSVIETLQLPPPKRGDEVFMREYALQPAARSLTGHRTAAVDRVFQKRTLSD